MTEEPLPEVTPRPAAEEPAPTPREPLPLGPVLAAVVLIGAVLDLFCLLLLPFRVAGHLTPVGPVLVFVLNAALATVANRLAADRMPAQVLVVAAILLSAAASARGPGGDLLVTADLQGLYLLFIITACLGAAVPLLRKSPRTRARPE